MALLHLNPDIKSEGVHHLLDFKTKPGFFIGGSYFLDLCAFYVEGYLAGDF
jgi:hypothetical protein